MDTIQEIKITLYWLLAILLMVSSMFINILQNARPWISPMSNKERWKRSIVIGLTAIVFCISLLMAVGLYASPGNLPPSKPILGLSCIYLPLSVLAVLGSYVRFGSIDRMKDTRDRFVGNIRKNDSDNRL
jgi:hypothetical protein